MSEQTPEPDVQGTGALDSVRPEPVPTSRAPQEYPDEGVLNREIEQAGQALLDLSANGNPELAIYLARILTVVAAEATRTQRFSRALVRAFGATSTNTTDSAISGVARRGGRRPRGPIDPFATYSEQGEEGLRKRLQTLKLEELRDIIAQYGMDNDRLAMKWKDSARVIERIVERVAARATKGSAFRGDSNERTNPTEPPGL